MPNVTKWLAVAQAVPNADEMPIADFNEQVVQSNNVGEYPLSISMMERLFEIQPIKKRSEKWRAGSRMVDSTGQEDGLPKRVTYLKVCSPWWCKELSTDEDSPQGGKSAQITDRQISMNQSSSGLFLSCLKSLLS